MIFIYSIFIARFVIRSFINIVWRVLIIVWRVLIIVWRVLIIVW